MRKLAWLLNLSLTLIVILFSLTFGLEAAEGDLKNLIDRSLGDSPPAESETLLDALMATRPFGHFRIYNFNRQNDNNNGVDVRSLAAGGEIKLISGSFKGFSSALWFYTVRSIGVYNPAFNQTTLVGPSHNLNTLAFAFLQYKNDHVLWRGGRHPIDTPFATHDVYTMLPRSFNGVSLTVRPLPWDKIRRADYMEPEGPTESFPATDFKKPSLHLFFSRMFQYESRFRDHFIQGNRYTDNYTPGLITFGLDYDHPVGRHLFYGRNYYYKFYDYAMLGYWEVGYRYDLLDFVKPFIGFQYVGQVNDGYSAFGRVRADVLGWQAGIVFPNGSIKFVTNLCLEHFNSFRHGGMVHPYNDISYTLFTDSMNDGFENDGPGFGWGFRVSYSLLEKSLDLSVSWLHYRIKYGLSGAPYATNGPFGFPQGTPIPNQVQWAVDPSLSYHFKGKLKGLHLVEDIGLRVSANAPYGPLLENRFRFIYEF